MSIEPVVTVVALTTSLLGIPVTIHTAWWAWHAHRSARDAQSIAIRTAAVADLADGLHRLRRLARQADVAAVTASDVSAAMVDFEDRHHRHRAVLPRHLQAVNREVRAAMGNCFGAAAMAGLDARLKDHDLASFDQYWWDVTRTYLDHVDICLQDWRTAPTRRRPTRLIHFYEWRRDEDAATSSPLDPGAAARAWDAAATCR